MTFHIRLDALRGADAGRIGGKAAGLYSLLQMGLPVPTGTVLTTEAFDRFVERNALVLRDFSYIETRCAELERRAQEAPLPAEIEEALRGFRGPVAVRSSATVEDGAFTAFAGVYHSELNAMDVAEAVRKCWSHAFSYSSVTHCLRNNMDPRRVKLALVIQEMLPADRSGVLFTQDPEGDAGHALLVVTQGIGERLMQGEVSGTSLRVPRDRSGLDDPVLRRLVRVGLQVEKELGRPQDIEWAVCGDRLWFLQTRPITTLEFGPPIHWTREISEERFPRPISPLGWSALQLLLKVNQETLGKRFGLVARRPDDVARTIEHYVYTNKRFFSIPGSLRPNPMTQARFWPEYLKEIVDVARHGIAAMRSSFGVRWLGLTRLFKAFVFPHAREVREAWDRNLQPLLQEMDAFGAVDPSRLATEELWRHKRRMESVARRYMEPDLAIYVVKTACAWMVEKIGAKLGTDPGFLSDVTAGVDNRTLKMNLELEELFESLSPEERTSLRAEQADLLRARLNGAFAKFVERNGHLTTNWDLMEPTWGEAPEKIFGLLRSYTRADRRRTYLENRESHRARFEEARRKVYAALPPWMATFFDELLDTLHAFMRIDEEHHFYCSRLFRPMRRVCAEFGKRLVAVGALEHPEEVWFLTLEEVAQAFQNPFPRRFVVEMRKASFARSRSTRPPDDFVGVRAIRHEEQVVGDTLRGVGASPGIAAGVVRVVETPEEVAAFEPGEILVTSTPNPAWTPMYAVAGALVTATGSVLSHGLVSAREYRLPAVIGIPDVSKKLHTGQRVKVDGYAGTIAFERA